MPFVFLLMIMAAYIALGTFAVCKIFTSAKPTMVAIALGVSNAMGYMAVVFNGIIPPIPLTLNDLVSFLFVSYIGLVGANTIALKLTIDSGQLNFISALLVSIALNLGLLILLGAPSFYTCLALSNMLFVAK